MALDCLLGGLYLGALRAAFAGQPFLLDREPNSFLADNHAIQVAPLFKVDNVARMHVLGDECAIKNGNLGNRDAPRSLSEGGIPAVEEEFDIWRVRRAQAGPTDDDCRIVRRERTED